MDIGDELPMILPKGIVINTKHIYKEVASHQIVPSSKVQEYWHVYTTTNKQLGDPTARRLENFWWHVWGSDRRHLRGQVLAKLYEDISLGPTFVPLKGPPNRWEGPDVRPLIQQAVSVIEQQAQAEARSEQTRTESTRAALNEVAIKSLSSSASKPPPPHPILKKARGPSSSGPRPTARFISPQESADESDKDGEIPSSGSTATTGLEMRPPQASSASSASPAKKKHVTKRFVASSTSKRRPVMARRASSQSSTGSEPMSREGSSSGASRGSAPQRAVSPIPEGPSHPASPTSGPNSQTTQQSIAGLSAKAAGKRPAQPRKKSEGGKVPSELSQTANDQQGRMNSTRPSSQQPSAALPHVQSLVNMPTHPRRQSETPASPLSPSRASQPGTFAPSSLGMARSQSHQGYERHRGSIGRTPNSGLFTGVTAATTNVAAQGTIIDQSGMDASSLSQIIDHQRDGYAMPSSHTEASVLSPHFSPTPPSASSSLPLGRTRSQLTLLLEREKEKIGERSRFRG